MKFRKTFLRGAALMLAAGLLLAPDANAVVKKKKSGKGARAAFEEGDNTIALGLGLGTIYSYANAGTGIAGVVSFDHGLIGDVGPGTIGIGGTVGFVSQHYDYYNGSRETWTNAVFGARGTYHLTLLKDKNNKFDPYGGVTIGARSYSYKDDYYGYTDTYVRPYAGLFVGAKYNFVPHFGVWAELGYDIAVFRFGINFNF